MNNLRGSAVKGVEMKVECYFPDEIVINILSRLPAKDVLNYRCVCRRWRDLTSDQNQFFVDMHLRFGVPMILDKSPWLEAPFLMDNWQTTRKRTDVSSKYRILFSDSDIQVGAAAQNKFFKDHPIRFSVNGLIASRTKFSSSNFIIFNPMNGENVRINLSTEIPFADLYGVYFHPLLKEYCTIWRISPKGWSELEQVEYKVLNLGSKPCWLKISNPSNRNIRIYPIHPVFIDKYLYWVAGQDGRYHERSWNSSVTFHVDIIEFDIISQELKLMPSPVPLAIKGDNCNINLLHMDGCLSLVQFFKDDWLADMNIWTLKDRVEQLWECSHYRIKLRVFPNIVNDLKAICALNGELAIQSDNMLSVYNLKRGSIKILEKDMNSPDARYCSHLMSFASLRNCKSNICMDDRGEVDNEEKKSLISGSKKEASTFRIPIIKESQRLKFYRIFKFGQRREALV